MVVFTYFLLLLFLLSIITHSIRASGNLDHKWVRPNPKTSMVDLVVDLAAVIGIVYFYL